MKINQTRFKTALKGSYGVQSVIAQKLDVTRQAVNQFINKYPKMKELCITEREKIIDVSENRLFKAANAGEKWAVDKILNTIGKTRGYIEKTEQSVEHKGDNQLKVVIERVNPDGDKTTA